MAKKEFRSVHFFYAQSVAPHGEYPDEEEIEKDEKRMVHVSEGAGGQSAKLEKKISLG